jgi:hypothetical protein
LPTNTVFAFDVLNRCVGAKSGEILRKNTPPPLQNAFGLILLLPILVK